MFLTYSSIFTFKKKIFFKVNQRFLVCNKYIKLVINQISILKLLNVVKYLTIKKNLHDPKTFNYYKFLSTLCSFLIFERVATLVEAIFISVTNLFVSLSIPVVPLIFLLLVAISALLCFQQLRRKFCRVKVHLYDAGWWPLSRLRSSVAPQPAYVPLYGGETRLLEDAKILTRLSSVQLIHDRMS